MDPLPGLKRANRIVAHTSFFRVRHMHRAYVRLRRQDEPALKHDQDLRADRPEHTRTQQAYFPQTPTGWQRGRQRHAPDIQGILHPRAVELDTLFAHDALRSV